MERSMFETLLELPLFQGLGKDDLTQIIETVKFNFTTFEQNQIIARQDEVCNHLLFLLKGNLTVTTKSDDHQFTLTERIQAPGVLQAEALYGIYPRFTHTYTAQSDTCILSVEKQAVNHIFMSYEVFRINIMNLLSTQIFKNQRLLWRSPAERLENKIVDFIITKVIYPAGEKTLYIKMEDLAKHLNVTRINVSKALNQMQKNGDILLKRKAIIIPALENLVKQNS